MTAADNKKDQTSGSESKTESQQQSQAASSQASTTPSEDTYPTDQLIADGDAILGQPGYLIEVALRHHGNNRKSHTLAQAEEAISKLNHEVEA